MKIYGIDFTSRPNRSKPITCLECTFEAGRLQANDLTEWLGFEEFEEALDRPGPWLAGIDFPFGQPRKFIENIGWPKTWQGYVNHVRALGKEGFRCALDNYRKNRAPGDKEHRRQTDIAANAFSPQKLNRPPVGLMFFEGAPRLLNSGVSVPYLKEGDPQRMVVEAYPGVLARRLIGRRSYKHDSPAKQTKFQREVRKELLRMVKSAEATQLCGFRVSAPMSLINDPGGDHIDALLCAIQAAWAWTLADIGYGARQPIDPLEGWIAGPAIGAPGSADLPARRKPRRQCR